MTADTPRETEDRGRILRFKRRTPAGRQAFGDQSAGRTAVPDIDKYARGGSNPDDYRHRMKMNALAAAVLVVLIGGGMWIIDTMAQMRKNQDCALSGRRNCAPTTMLQGNH
jgi:hypothetical protein